MEAKWNRASKARPCVICGKPDYCGYSSDESVAVCMRVKSDRPTKNGGWLHKTGDPIPEAAQRVVVKQKLTDAQLHNRFAPLVRQWFVGKSEIVGRLAAKLGVSKASLDALCVGWKWRAWTFPERNAAGLFIGVTQRSVDGTKRCVLSSRRGLTFADGWDGYEGPAVIVEGGSDVAALLTMGLCAIGRPSNVGGCAMLVKLLRGCKRKIIVMGENDHKDDGLWPGRDGALRVSYFLAHRLIDRKVLTRFPPSNHKDVRAFLNATKVDPEDDLACRKVGKSLMRRLA